jgi:hypothetical protein
MEKQSFQSAYTGCVFPESKKYLKCYEACQKDIGVNLKKLPMAKAKTILTK